MCLIVDRKKFFVPCVALEDVECYKVLEKSRDSNERFSSPFARYSYYFGVENESRLKVYGESVEDGFHSYVSVDDAFRMKDILTEYLFKLAKALHPGIQPEEKEYNLNVVVKCVIPKGSSYYIGEVNTGYEEEIGENGVLPEGYASDRIRIMEIVGENL